MVHILTEKGPNFVISQPCLNFKCMKVNIPGMCNIMMPNLQRVVVSFRSGCVQFILYYSVKVKSTFSSHFFIYPGYFKQYIDQNTCESTGQDYGSNKNWNQSVNVLLDEHIGWSQLCMDIIFANLYMSRYDHPLCILINKLLCLSFTTMCVKYDPESCRT